MIVSEIKEQLGSEENEMVACGDHAFLLVDDVFSFVDGVKIMVNRDHLREVLSVVQDHDTVSYSSAFNQLFFWSNNGKLLGQIRVVARYKEAVK